MLTRMLFICLLALICTNVVTESDEQDEYKRLIKVLYKNILNSYVSDHSKEHDSEKTREKKNYAINEDTIYNFLSKYMVGRNENNRDADGTLGNNAKLEKDAEEVDEVDNIDEMKLLKTRYEDEEVVEHRKVQQAIKGELNNAENTPKQNDPVKKEQVNKKDEPAKKDEVIKKNEPIKIEEPKLYANKDKELENKIKEAFGDTSQESLFGNDDIYEQELTKSLRFNDADGNIAKIEEDKDEIKQLMNNEFKEYNK